MVKTVQKTDYISSGSYNYDDSTFKNSIFDWLCAVGIYGTDFAKREFRDRISPSLLNLKLL